MSKSSKHLTTKEQFKAILRKNGVTQVEKGCHELYNTYQEDMLTKVTTAGKINADHNKHRGLQKSDADAAIDIVKEIPKGVY